MYHRPADAEWNLPGALPPAGLFTAYGKKRAKRGAQALLALALLDEFLRVRRPCRLHHAFDHRALGDPLCATDELGTWPVQMECKLQTTVEVGNKGAILVIGEVVMFHVDDRVVADGTNRVGDLEYRVCEMEEGCDIATLGKTKPLGGEAGTAR